MIHSTILINLRQSNTDEIQLSPIPSTYKGPIDDLLIFSYVVQRIASKSSHNINYFIFVK